MRYRLRVDLMELGGSILFFALLILFYAALRLVVYWIMIARA